MFIANRSSLTVRPEQPYIDWANSFPDGLGWIEGESTAYLTPEFLDEAAEQAWLRENYSLIFEHELSAWDADESTWPKERDWETFRAWFRLEHQPLVYDLGDTPLETEEDL